MLTDSLYWLGTYQIELDGLHDCSMCSLILRVVSCHISGVYLMQISGGCWLTAEIYHSTNLTISHILQCLIEVLGGGNISINKAHIFSKSEAHARIWSIFNCFEWILMCYCKIWLHEWHHIFWFQNILKLCLIICLTIKSNFELKAKGP